MKLTNRIDTFLLAMIVGISLFGWLMVTSSSMTVAAENHHDPYYYSIRQLAHLLLMYIVMFVVMVTPLPIIKKSVPWVFLCSVILLVLIFIPGIGRHVNGSTRWLNLFFFSFEISELIKCSVIMYLARYLSDRSSRSWLKLFLWFMMIALLLLMQPDFGALFVLTFIVLTMGFLSGVSLRYFILIGSVLSMALIGVMVQQPYRMERIATFYDPWSQPYDQGYQLIQSLIAIGNGGFWGVGIGNSIQKWFYLPESHTDFIFSIIVEELGAGAGLALIIAYLVLILHIIWSGVRKTDAFSQNLHFGVGAWLLIQVIIGLCVPLGLLPTKGLTLPLISYGGSSLLALGMAFGLLLKNDSSELSPKEQP